MMRGITGDDRCPGDLEAARTEQEAAANADIRQWAEGEGLTEPTDYTYVWSDDGVTLSVRFRCGDRHCGAIYLYGLLSVTDP